ncbi:MAG: AraC family transcriptional regulator [Lachnospiraceae bacterium]|nr:AraC family transcriptional regulator [Lachnospiraceae bacterium]
MFSKEKKVFPDSDYYLYSPSLSTQNIFLYPTIVGHFRYMAGYGLYRDSYDSFLCFLVRKGSCKIQIYDRTFTAEEGQIALIDCYIPHSYRSDAPWEAEWFHFDGILARKYYEMITQNENVVFYLNSTYRFEKNLNRLYLSFKNTNVPDPAVLNNLIVNMMTELIVSREQSDKYINREDVIEDTVSYISDNLSGELSLKALAERANLSPFYFSRLFKSETGFAPYDYILTLRINHAKYLLLSTSSSIKDICFQLGFGSESAFCTAFRKKVGQTPKEFRTKKA